MEYNKVTKANELHPFLFDIFKIKVDNSKMKVDNFEKH